jgi:hypothetical protein
MRLFVRALVQLGNMAERQRRRGSRPTAHRPAALRSGPPPRLGNAAGDDHAQNRDPCPVRTRRRRPEPQPRPACRRRSDSGRMRGPAYGPPACARGGRRHASRRGRPAEVLGPGGRSGGCSDQVLRAAGIASAPGAQSRLSCGCFHGKMALNLCQRFPLRRWRQGSPRRRYYRSAIAYIGDLIRRIESPPTNNLPMVGVPTSWKIRCAVYVNRRLHDTGGDDAPCIGNASLRCDFPNEN